MHPSTRRRVGWILGLGLFGASVAAGAALGLRATEGGGDALEVAIEVPPLASPVGEPTAVPEQRISVTATSFLAPVDGITYDPGNLIDNALDTAWNSDVAGSDVQDQRLTFRFTEPVDLRAIQFVNGYAKSPDIFDSNHRVRELMIQTDGASQRVTLLDTTDPQEIAFAFGFTSKVVLEIIDIYPGSGFDNPELEADLALTEVDFVAVQR